MTKQKQKTSNKKTLTKTKHPKMPKWMDCAWRRVPCNKNSCKICREIKRESLAKVAKGEDPNHIGAAFEDIGNNFRKALVMIKKDAQKKGIDITSLKNIKEPPKPEKFSLYRKVSAWRDSIYDIAESAEENGGFWLATEAAEDLLWYSNTFAAKTYRQLCNRWHIERKDSYGEFDYSYTKYVLSEVAIILKNSLSELAYLDSEQKGELMLALAQILEHEKKTLEI